jgi:hypothetical protein
MMLLRMVSLFNNDLRGLLQVAPNYMKPVRYDARKLQGLLGIEASMTGECGPRVTVIGGEIGSVRSGVVCGIEKRDVEGARGIS